MSYYIARRVLGDFDDVVTRTKQALQAEGFGVLTEIDVTSVFKKKIDVDFRPYLILGACNPHLAHGALQAEDKIGVMLPCNVIIQQTEDSIEVAAVDPVASLGRVGNDALTDTAGEVKAMLERVIASI